MGLEAEPRDAVETPPLCPIASLEKAPLVRRLAHQAQAAFADRASLLRAGGGVRQRAALWAPSVRRPTGTYAADHSAGFGFAWALGASALLPPLWMRMP
jgi:hypothetical protein